MIGCVRTIHKLRSLGRVYPFNILVSFPEKCFVLAFNGRTVYSIVVMHAIVAFCGEDSAIKCKQVQTGQKMVNIDCSDLARVTDTNTRRCTQKAIIN